MSVVVRIQDPTGTEIGSFEAEDEKNLCEMAAMHGIEILKSCGAWFCGVCMCEVLEGWEAIDVNKTENAGISTWDPKNPDHVLWCVWGIKSEMFNDEKEHVVVLKKMY